MVTDNDLLFDTKYNGLFSVMSGHEKSVGKCILAVCFLFVVFCRYAELFIMNVRE